MEKIVEQFNSDQKHLAIVIKKICNLPKNKKYKLIDIGAAERHLEKKIPKNIKYSSLDYTGKQDYVFNLDDGQLPLKDNSYDIVVCLETLEHVLYPEKVMKELLRVGKKDAIFILSMPNEFNIWLRMHYLLNKKPENQAAFKTIINHQHIHTPRAKDVYDFFSDFIEINNVNYIWQSRNSRLSKGLKQKIILFLDKLFDNLVKVNPDLFSRIVLVSGRRKTVL